MSEKSNKGECSMRHAIVLVITVICLSFITACSSGNDNGGTDGSVGDNGGTETNLADLFLASDEISGWQESTDAWPAGVQITEDLQEAYGAEWVNGAMDEFSKYNWKALGREQYAKDDLVITLFIYEMQDAASAGQVYEAMKSHYSPSTDHDYAAGQDNALYSLMGKTAYAVGTKDKFYVEVNGEPESIISGECGADCEAAAKEFATAVFNKIP
jgi:hypothetical protein